MFLRYEIVLCQPFDNHITFNGNPDYIEIPNNQNFHIQGDFTIETLVRFPDFALDSSIPQYTIFINCIEPDNWGFFIALELIDGNLVGSVGVVIDFIQYEVYSSTNLNPETWYHLAGMRNNTELKIYLNGQLENITQVPTLPLRSGNGVNRIGRAQNDSNGFFTGSIDELRIWNYARSDGEITEAWDNEVSSNSTGLIAYYKMNEIGFGDGIVVENSSQTLGEQVNGLTFGTNGSPFFSSIGTNQESNAITCSDGIDNDGDGLIDCEDDGCFDLPVINCVDPINCYEVHPCELCSEISYADTVIQYEPECLDNLLIIDMIEDNTGIIGYADYFPVLSLGTGGFVTIGFTNNYLTNSGDDSPDIYIFEGGEPEGCSIFLLPFDEQTREACIQANLEEDSTGFFYVGEIGGMTNVSSLDIDNLFDQEVNSLLFDQVKILDDGLNSECNVPFGPGADIDAVCALSSVPVISTNSDVEDMNLTIYPNPTRGRLYLMSNSSVNEPINYRVFSLDGSLLKQGMAVDGYFSIEGLSSGLYVIELTEKSLLKSYMKVVKL